MPTRPNFNSDPLIDHFKSVIVNDSGSALSAIASDFESSRQFLYWVLDHSNDPVEWCSRILSGGDNLSSVLNRLRTGQARCSVSWNSSHIAYRCKTCAVSVTSCICSNCFINSNHEGHDFTIYRCELGGCCDCGDVHAWKHEGFCSLHSGVHNPSDIINTVPPVVRPRLQLCISFAVLVLVNALHSSDDRQIISSARWLKELASISDGIRSIAVAELLEHSVQRCSSQVNITVLPSDLSELNRFNAYDNAGIIQLMVKYGIHASADVEHELSTLWLECTFDICFKIAFGRVFLQYYAAYLQRTLSLPSRALDTLPVQLFSIVDVANKLSAEENLVAVLIDACDQLFSKAIDDGAINLLHPLICNHRYWKVVHDVTFVLMQKVPAQELRNRSDLMSTIVKLLVVIQNAPVLGYPSSKITTCWESLYRLELDLMVLFNSLLQGVSHVDGDDPSCPELRRLIDLVIFQLVITSEEHRSGDFNPSLSRPLHRALTLALIHLKWRTNNSLESLGSLTSEVLQMVLPDLLRTVSFVRNVKGKRIDSQGASLSAVINVYESSSWNYFGLDLDQTLLQICAMRLPADEFWKLFFDVFSLQDVSADVFNTTPDFYFDLYGVVELMFTLSLPFNRLWYSNEDYAKLEIIHFLAASDRTFSQLKDCISSFVIEDNQLLEAILHEVADFHVPINMKPGTYSLKPKFWGVVNANYPHLNAAGRNAIKSRHPKSHPNSVLLCPANSLSESILCHLQSRVAYSLVYMVLYIGDNHNLPTPDHNIDTCISYIIDILYLIATQCNLNLINQQRSEVHLFEISSHCLTLKRIYENLTDDFTDFIFLHPKGYPSIPELLFRCRSENSSLSLLYSICENFFPKIFPISGGTAALTSSERQKVESNTRKQKFKQRQAQLLAKYEIQRNLFSLPEPDSEIRSDVCSICCEDISADNCAILTFMELSNRYRYSFRDHDSISTNYRGIAVYTCCHRIHIKCHLRFAGSHVFAEFPCPVCRQPCNSWIPTNFGSSILKLFLSSSAVKTSQSCLDIALHNLAYHETSCRPLLSEWSAISDRSIGDMMSKSIESLQNPQFSVAFSLLCEIARRQLQSDNALKISSFKESFSVFEDSDIIGLVKQDDVELFVFRHWIASSTEHQKLSEWIQLGYAADVLKALFSFIQHSQNEIVTELIARNMGPSCVDVILAKALPFIHEHCLCFLRRTYMAYHALSVPVNDISDHSHSGQNFAEVEFEALRQSLSLPPLPLVFSSWRQLIHDQVHQLQQRYCIRASLQLHLSSPTLPCLIPLPRMYHALFTDLISRSECCIECNVAHPAICLVCSTICYFGHSCSHTSFPKSSVLSHAGSCGSGKGIFLLTNECIVLLVSEGRHSLWGSIYLDAHGEEDFEMARGSPLFLSHERYQELNRLWWTKSLVYHTSSSLTWATRED